MTNTAPKASAPAPALDTFVFDLDDTLLHTLPDLVVLTNTVLRELGYPEHTDAEIRSYVGNGIRALMYQAVPEGTPQPAADRALERWKELFPTCGTELTRPYEGIPAVLAELRGHGCKLAVLSNKFEGGVLAVMNRCLPGQFDVLHGESEGFPRKLDPAGLLRTIDELGSTPARTAYVGDSPGDVRAARNAGVHAVAVAWGYHAEEDFADEGAEPDAMLHAPAELLDLVARRA